MFVESDDELDETINVQDGRHMALNDSEAEDDDVFDGKFS